MTTVIAGKGIGSRTRVTTTDPAVIKLLVEADRASYGRACARQGSSNTFWCGQQVVAAVEELLAE